MAAVASGRELARAYKPYIETQDGPCLELGLKEIAGTLIETMRPS
jgi:hypothetical protein